jgi:peptidyl-tRNA hydrolase
MGEKDVEKHILGLFKPHELSVLKGIFKKSTEALEAAITDSPERAMNQFN